MSTQAADEFSPNLQMQYKLHELEQSISHQPLGNMANGEALQEFRKAFDGATLYCVMQAKPKIQVARGEEDIVQAASQEEKQAEILGGALGANGGTLEGEALQAFLERGTTHEPEEVKSAYIVFSDANAALKAKKMFGEVMEDGVNEGHAMPFSNSVPVSMSPGNPELKKFEDSRSIYFEVPPRFVAEVQRLNELERDNLKAKGEEPHDLVTVKKVADFAAIKHDVKENTERSREPAVMGI